MLIQYNIMGGFQLNNTEVNVLRFLIRNMGKDFSIKRIGEEIEKTYPIVRESVLRLSEQNIIKIKEVNPTQNLCSINVTNDSIGLISYAEFVEKKNFFSKKPNIKLVMDDILKRIEGNSFSLIVFGSHAKQSDKKTSDIDVLFLVQSGKDEKRMTAAVKGAERLSSKKIHLVIMTYKDFFELLKKNETNLAKEVIENHIFVYGAEAFFRWMVTHG